jgi:outer membrane lipoprotein-sorting protein
MVITAASGYTGGPSAEDILAKVIEAQGGRETLDKIRDRTIAGTMNMIQAGSSASVTMYQKKPNKMRMEFEVSGEMMIQGYDGKSAWYINPQTGKTQEVPAEAAKDIRRQAIGNDALLNPKKYGVTYEYRGSEKVKEKDCHVLQQIFADGYTVSHFFDSKTFFLVKSESTDKDQNGVEVRSETYYTEYKKVEGVPTPHEVSILQDGREFTRIKIVQVKFNSGLEDSLFKMN